MKFIRYTTTSLLLLTAFWSVPLYTQGASLVSIEFEQTPLFSEANFLPGNSVTRSITVTNNATNTEPILIQTENESDPNNFAEAIDLVIAKSGSPVWDGTLAEFFAEDSVALGSVSPQQTTIFTLTATFRPESGNEFQNLSLSFDLVISYTEGSVSDVPDDGTGGGGGGGGGNTDGVGGDNDSSVTTESTGGGGGGTITQLVILSQNVDSIDPILGTAHISWVTNLLSTSQVVFGPANTLYSLNLSAPNFGYPSGTVQDSSLVTEHGAGLSGLSLGTYRFRVVSRLTPSSLPTIGSEGLFTLGVSFPANQVSQTQSGDNEVSQNPDAGESGGASTNNVIANAFGAFENSDGNGNNETPEPDVSNLAAAFFAIPQWLLDNLDCVAGAFVWIIILYAIWALWKQRYNNGILSPPQILFRRIMFFIVGSVLVVILAVMFSWCLLWPFVVLSVLFLLGLLLRLR